MSIYKLRTEFINKKLLQTITDEEKRLLSVGFIPDSMINEYNEFMPSSDEPSDEGLDIDKISNSNFFAINKQNVFGVSKAGSGFLNPTIVSGNINDVLSGLNFFLSKSKDIHESEQEINVLEVLEEIAVGRTHNEFMTYVKNNVTKNYGLDLTDPKLKQKFIDALGLTSDPTKNEEKLSKFYYKEGKQARKNWKQQGKEIEEQYKKDTTSQNVNNIINLAHTMSDQMDKDIAKYDAENESKSKIKAPTKMAKNEKEVTPEIGFGSAELAIIAKNHLLDDDTNQKKTITIEESILKYNKGISKEEIQAWVWYKRQFGNPMKGWEAYFLDGTNKQMVNVVVKTKTETTTKDNAFRDLLLIPAGVIIGKKTKFKNEYRDTQYIVVRSETNELLWVDASAVEEIKIKTEAPQEEIDRLINAGALIFDGVDYFPVPVFLFGDIYKRIRDLKENEELIVNKYGEKIFKKQLELTISYKPKIRSFREQVKSSRPHLLSLSEFAQSTDKFGVVELNDETGVKLGRTIRNRFETNTEKITLFSAFQFWFRESVKDTDIRNTTKVNIERFYWAKSIRWEKDSKGNEVYTQAQKDEMVGNARITCEELFSDFLATALTYEDSVELDVIWNETFNAFTNINQFVDKIPVAYSGSTMFKDGSLEIRSAQRHGLAFLQLVGSGCVAYDVGFGKTLTGILNIAQLMAQGKTVRPLVVVPKPTYTNWLRELFGYWTDGTKSEFFQFPNARYHYGVLSGSNIKLNDWYNLSGAHYKKLLEASGGDLNKLIPENTITVVSYKGFEQMGFSRDINDELLSSITKVLQQKETFKDEKEETGFLETVKGWLGLGNKNAIIMVDKVGFDHITVDEAHNFKNVFSNCGRDAKTGRKLFDISASQSTRAVKMFFITQYLQRKFGKNVVLLTATPFTNSPLEMYSMLSFIGLDTLNHYNLYNIKKFFENFILETVEYAINVKGEIITKPVIKSFQNLKLLQTILYNHFDYKDNPKEAGVVRPCLVPLPNNDINTYIDMNEWQKRNQLEVVALAKTSGRANMGAVLQAINKSLDNAFSPYLFANETPESAEDFVKQSPKVEYTMECIRTIKKWHEDRNEDVSGCLIYTNRGKQYFDYIKEYLIDDVGFKRGVSYDDETLDEVEIIVGAGSEAEEDRKELIKDAFNAGIVKVIIGTATIREGLNLQARSANTFDLYPEWNPTQIHQLKGRNWRQGNRFGYVRFTIPLVINSMDNFVYQKQDEKSKRISSLWNNIGDSNVDELTSDLDPSEVKYELVDNADEKFKLKHETIEREASRMLGIVKEAQRDIEDIDDNIERLKSSAESIYGDLKDELPDWSEYLNILKTKVLPLAKKMDVKFLEKVNLSIARVSELIKDLLDYEASGQSSIDKLLKVCRDLRVRKAFLDTDESIAQQQIRALIIDYRWRFSPPYERRVDILKSSFADIKYFERNILAPYKKAWFDDLSKVRKEINGRVNEAQAYLESLKDETYKAGLMSEIEAELSAKKALRGDIQSQVVKFASLNYLLSYLSDNTDRENCPIPTDVCCPTNGIDVVYKENSNLTEPVIISEFIEKVEPEMIPEPIEPEPVNTNPTRQELEDVIAGYRIMIDTVDESEKQQYIDAVEGIEILLETMEPETVMKDGGSLLYDTEEKKIKTIKKKGKIITFKERFYPRGTSENGNTQIIVMGFKKDKSGSVKIEGRGYDSPWFDNMDKLIDAIDWESMEAWHSGDDNHEEGGEITPVKLSNERSIELASRTQKSLGNKALLMLGAYDIYADNGALIFKIRMSNKWKGITIRENSLDYFDVTFKYWRKKDFSDYREKVFKNIPIENLHKLIEEETGLYLKLADGGNVEGDSKYKQFDILTDTPESHDLNSKTFNGKRHFYFVEKVLPKSKYSNEIEYYVNSFIGALGEGGESTGSFAVAESKVELYPATADEIKWLIDRFWSYRKISRNTSGLDSYTDKLSALVKKLNDNPTGETELLTISNENPLSTQLSHITGDSFNSIDFEPLEGDFLSTTTPFRHKKSGRIFSVVPKVELVN